MNRWRDLDSQVHQSGNRRDFLNIIPKSPDYGFVWLWFGQLILNTIDVCDDVHLIILGDRLGFLQRIAQLSEGFTNLLIMRIDLVAVTESDDVLPGGLDFDALEPVPCKFTRPAYLVDTRSSDDVVRSCRRHNSALACGKTLRYRSIFHPPLAHEIGQIANDLLACQPVRSL